MACNSQICPFTCSTVSWPCAQEIEFGILQEFLGLPQLTWKSKKISIYIYIYQNGRTKMFLTFWRTNSNDKRVEFRWVQLRKEPRPVCFSPAAWEADPIESRKKLDRRKKKHFMNAKLFFDIHMYVEYTYSKNTYTMYIICILLFTYKERLYVDNIHNT